MAEPTVGPRALAQPVAFRNVARPLPPDVDWARGIAYVSPNCTPLQTFGRCTTVDLDEAAGANAVVWWPWTAALAPVCDEGVHDDAAEQYLADIQQLLEVATDQALAAELWTGATRATNPKDPSPPSIQALAQPTTIVPTGLIGAFATLLDARINCGAIGGGIWHIAPQLIPAALDRAQIVQTGGTYIGPLGYPVITDIGYADNWGQADTDGIVALTGPVRYAAGPIVIDPSDPAMRRMDPRTNQWRVWAKRDLLVDVDPCCAFSVNVTVPEFAT